MRGTKAKRVRTLVPWKERRLQAIGAQLTEIEARQTRARAPYVNARRKREAAS